MYVHLAHHFCYQRQAAPYKETCKDTWQICTTFSSELTIPLNSVENSTRAIAETETTVTSSTSCKTTLRHWTRLTFVFSLNFTFRPVLAMFVDFIFLFIYAGSVALLFFLIRGHFFTMWESQVIYFRICTDVITEECRQAFRRVIFFKIKA